MTYANGFIIWYSLFFDSYMEASARAWSFVIERNSWKYHILCGSIEIVCQFKFSERKIVDCSCPSLLVKIVACYIKKNWWHLKLFRNLFKVWNEIIRKSAKQWFVNKYTLDSILAGLSSKFIKCVALSFF